jgi:prophage tail gpP-like protein
MVQKPNEIATLIVNGQRFEDWESVMVRRSWNDPYAYFQFTAAERDPLFRKVSTPFDWRKLQFKPGDHCTVLLAGQLAITGFIEMRQVAYDATQHGVTLLGKSYTAQGSKSSVDTKTGSFDGRNIVQVCTEVWGPYSTPVKVIGSVDMTPFDKLQNNIGETVWDFCERIARDRKVRLACDAFGKFLLIGEHSMRIVANLVEGKNILKMQCVINAEMVFEEYDVRGHSQATDDHNMRAASEQQAKAKSVWESALYSKLIVPIEEAVKFDNEMKLRVDFEQRVHDYQQITATVIVQGWLRQGIALWQEGDAVWVDSPMAMLNEEMKIQQVVFTQDSAQGSLTTLTLVNPAWLNAHPDYDASQPSAPAPPASPASPASI